MVRRIKIVDVCSYEEETLTQSILSQQADETSTELRLSLQADEAVRETCNEEADDDDDDYDEIVEEKSPEVEVELEVAKEPRTSQVEVRTSKSKKQILDMPTTNKIVEQVQCLSCGKSMSAKTLKYSHAKYCTKRNVETQPEEIPVPQIEFKSSPTLKERKTLPVKRAKTKAKTEEYDADEVPPQPPPPPSREKLVKPETPDQFWNNTLKNMKEKKMQQYKALCSNAF